MSTKDFTANVISATKVVPDGNFKNSKASGIWDINEALDLIKGGNWPNAANFSPSAFVDGLFQTHLYDGNSSTQAINNGIDLTKGGLVWIKRRDGNLNHALFDTARGAGAYIAANIAAGHYTGGDDLTAFNSNGFTLGDGQFTSINYSSYNYASWTFRKQPKFFDVVKYEGTGSARTVAHSLGTTVGMIIVKNLDQSDNWAVYHRANTAAPQTDYLILNTTAATADDSAWWNDTAPTTSVFTVGTDHSVNADGENYVAYLFAHNDDDGGFGEPGDQDIIKCGGYTGTGDYTANEVNLGFEPQWLLIKKVTADGSNKGWVLVDNMRGWSVDGGANWIYPNTNDAEQVAGSLVKLTSTGFKPNGSSLTASTNDAFIYMAIRRGGMQTPTAASDLFGIANFTSDNTNGRNVSTAPDFPDLIININRNSGNNSSAVIDRIRGSIAEVSASGDAAEGEANTEGYVFDTNSGLIVNNSGYYDYPNFGTSHKQLIPYWKRAKSYLDIVAYTGTGSARTISHNLGAVPEMMWVKMRDGAKDWAVYHSGPGETKEGRLNSTASFASSSDRWNNTAPTASVFTVGDSGETNLNDSKYIAYLFATAAGVSKVGSFTQSGATNVACGFTGNTPAFILLKRTDATGNWYVFDSARGIVAGNDTHSYLNATASEITNADLVDPYSGGFATTSNIADGDYIFYAIAAIS